jgi:O-antigen biosynthesis protein
MKVAFLVNDLQLSGGVGVVVHHCRQLAAHHGFDVAIVMARPADLPAWRYEALQDLRVLDLGEARDERFDVAVATWWETCGALFELTADRYAYFVQSFEDRFYPPDEPNRLGAALTLDLPVSFITEARWIRDTLAQLRPDADCFFVRNGMDKAIFTPPAEVTPRVDGPLRVLVEGMPGVWFKGVPEALDAASRMREAHETTLVVGNREGLGDVAADRVIGPVPHRDMAAVYAETDVLLKLSRVEGMYGPPLEGFHLGATCVTTEVTGHEEYVVHGFNALVCDWDDPQGTARQLDLLARDRRLLHELRHNALLTARAWPSWEQAGQFMALALREIHRRPAPGGVEASRRMVADVRAGVELYRRHISERNEYARQVERLDRVKNLPVLGHVRRAWRHPAVQRTIGPAVLRFARRLLRR